MNFPLVTIAIITYNRYDELHRTVAALQANTTYPNLRYLISDDCSPDNYASKLRKSKALKGCNVISTPVNSGWGANANFLLQHAHKDCEYVFLIEDDYILTTPLDLRVGMALLLERPNIGYLRYRGTAGDHMLYHQFEADISAYVPEYREGVGLHGKLTYLQLDNASHSLYVYTNGAHLRTRAFTTHYGAYRTDLKLGQTEEAYAHTVKDIMRERWSQGAPALAILPEWIHNRFDHVGVSWQHKAEDKEHK